MSIGIKISVDATRYGGFSAEALAWKSKIIANGGSISDSVLAIFDAQFFIPAVANGNILTQADRINIWKGQGNEIAALTSIVGNILATNVGGITWNNTVGYSSNTTTKYLNLNFNVSSGTKFLQNDNSFGFIVSGNTGGAGQSMGVQSGVSFYCNLNIISSVAVGSANMLGASSANNLVSQTFSGYSVVGSKRANSANAETFKDANSISKALASTGPISQNMFETCQAFNGNPNSNDGSQIHCASWNGSSSFDYLAFKTLVTNLFTALGV